LAKIGRIPVRGSRPLVGTSKTVTCSREADRGYVAGSCAEVPLQPVPPTGQETGLDLGLEACATLADGTGMEHPRHDRRAEKPQRRNGATAQRRNGATAQRRVACRKPGSTRRQQAVRLLAKAQQQMQRRDVSHTTALALVRQYDTIAHEDVRVAHLRTNHHLAKSIVAAGWAGFLRILSHQAACAGRSEAVLAVDPAYTSQLCSTCGALVEKGLSVR
jgi:putative transposase